MNSGLVVLGIIFLLGSYYVSNVMITPQEKAQIETANQLCNANVYGVPLGQIGQAISQDVAQSCQQAEQAKQILSMTPFGYLAGFIFLVAGIAVSNRKEHEPKAEKTEKIIESHRCEICKKEYSNLRDVGKCEARHEMENKKETNKPLLKREIQKTKFCTKCGTKVKEGIKFCTKCGKRI